MHFVESHTCDGPCDQRHEAGRVAYATGQDSPGPQSSWLRWCRGRHTTTEVERGTCTSSPERPG